MSKQKSPLNRIVKRYVTVVVTLLLALFFMFADALWPLEYRVQDFVFQEAGVLHPDIFVIGIDEYALETFGPFGQWTRELMAEAISILNRYEDARPTVIAVDVLYAEPSIRYPEYDQALIDAVREGGNVVLPSNARVGIDRDALTQQNVILDVVLPFGELSTYAHYGLVNAGADRDAVIRHAPLWQEFEGRRYYSFPLTIARLFAEYHGYEINESFIADNPVTYIRYTGLPGNPGDFWMYSFADIFEDWFDPAGLADAIVLIGPYAMGMMDDHPVSIQHDVNMYGVEIHANVVQAILENALKQSASPVIAVLIPVILLVLGMFIMELVDKIYISLGLLVVGVGYFFLAQHIYSQGYVLPILAPLLALILVFLYQLIYAYVLGSVEKSRMRNIFKKYVDPKLVDVLIQSGEADSDAVGKKKDIAVLFVDVRGFTPMTEKLRAEPEKIVSILNEYLELTSSAVFDNGGSVDKFIGDATMALFNGFVPLDDHVFAAAKAAWDMVQKAEAVNQSILKQHGVEIGFGIGLHCGEAIVGNLGPSFRKDYTAIGDAVNTAARLESNAQKSQVLMSEDVFNIIKDRVTAESLGAIPLKGKSEEMEIYSLTGIK
ncbi:MAG: adenylate/guanylate cyclase domain-containing protein [Defluviitaleaceae bacterium]|nr:adenylate/guanylate cyclase domain-containing protein [Defluviitaleaceae bacterium]